MCVCYMKKALHIDQDRVANPGFKHIMAVMEEVHLRAGDVFKQVKTYQSILKNNIKKLFFSLKCLVCFAFKTFLSYK